MDPNECNLFTDMKEVLGTPLSSAVRDAFGLMELAEEEIATAVERWPLQAPVLRNCFMLLSPNSDLFRGKGDVLYRKHCRELLDRVAEGGDHRDPTKAELACFLCDASQEAPMQHDAAALYMRVFRDLFPDNTMTTCYDGSWEGAVEEVERDVRRRLRRAINRNPPGRNHADH